MKRSLILLPIIAILTLCMFEACKKEQDPSRVAPISTPVITLNGPADTTLSTGASWTDPGASWYDTVTGEKGTAYAVIIQANYTLTPFVPNTSVDTAYLLNYIVLNKNGFPSALLSRGLGVTNVSNSVDISGAYMDSNGGRDSVYKVSRGLFYITAADAQSGFPVPPYPNYSNPSVICVKSDMTIAVATIYTSDLTGAYIWEQFSQASINYSRPITFTYTPLAQNVPPPSAGNDFNISYSALGYPLCVPLTFTNTLVSGGGAMDAIKTKFSNAQ